MVLKDLIDNLQKNRYWSVLLIDTVFQNYSFEINTITNVDKLNYFLDCEITSYNSNYSFGCYSCIIELNNLRDKVIKLNNFDYAKINILTSLTANYAMLNLDGYFGNSIEELKTNYIKDIANKLIKVDSEDKTNRFISDNNISWNLYLPKWSF